MLVDYSIVPTYVTYFDFLIAYVEILVLANPCAMKGTSYMRTHKEEESILEARQKVILSNKSRDIGMVRSVGSPPRLSFILSCMYIF